MLVKLNGDAAWVDVAALEFTHDFDVEEGGPGTITHYHGIPAFVAFTQPDGKLILVNSRHVVALRAVAGGTLLETARDQEVTVSMGAEKAAGLINKARLQA